VTRLDRENEKGKDNKELKANHKIIRKINKKFIWRRAPKGVNCYLSSPKS